MNVDHCWPFTLIPVFAFPLQPMVDPQTPIFASKSQLAINHRGLWVGGLVCVACRPTGGPVHLSGGGTGQGSGSGLSDHHMRRTLFIISSSGGSILLAAGKSAAVNLSSSQNVNVPL